jgi:DNA-binding MarR family transcriptional regulator
MNEEAAAEGDPRAAIGEALFRVARAVMFGSDRDSPLTELPVSQLRCLRVVGYHEGLKMQDLAARMDVKLSALSQVVDRLVKKGMVERRPDAEDRRVVRLHLTDEARPLLDAMKRTRETRLSAAVAELDPEALPRVIEGMRLLAAAGERAQAKARAEREEAARPEPVPTTKDAETLPELIDRQESEGRLRGGL